MDILFDRDTRHDRVATERLTVDGVDAVRAPYFATTDDAAADTVGDGEQGLSPVDAVELIEPADVPEQVQYLTDEVDHLRACIDHLLDLLEAQSQVADDVDLLFDRLGVTERRIQRVEDSYDGPRRRAQDQA